MSVTIQLRRDPAASWTAVNPVLSAGEIGVETDTEKLKIGDGATAWNSLAYWAGGGLTNPMTTLGDLIYGGASGAGTRLAGPTGAGTWHLISVPSAGVAQAPGWTRALSPTVVTLTQSSGNVTVDLSLGNDFRLLLTASGWTILNPINGTEGQQFTLSVTQDGTGGRTIGSWGSQWKWGTGGSAPLLSTAANARDLLGFKWYADVSKAAYVSAAFPQGY